MKWLGIILGLIFAFACAANPAKVKVTPGVVVCPELPKIDVEPPPELYPVKWQLLIVDGERLYVLTPSGAERLITDVELLKEYADRCYSTIKVLQEVEDEDAHVSPSTESAGSGPARPGSGSSGR